MFGGWSQWNLGIPNEEIEKIKKKQKFGTKKSTKTRGGGGRGRDGSKGR